MKSIILACETLKNELSAAMAQIGCNYEIRWIESGLHNVPEKLKAHLQMLLDSCDGIDTVLLAMSFCGNSVVGLKTGSFRLIIPRCDDCITLLLGSPERRQSISATYFLTEGWLKGEQNLWREYEYCIQKYGEKRGKRIFSALLAHYKKLALLDTGCFDMETAEIQIRKIAQVLGLEYTHIDGTLDYIRQLLSGNWSEERFVLIPPNSIVTSNDCTLKGAPNGLSNNSLSQ